MIDKNLSSNDKENTKKEFNLNDIPRCLKCSLICSIKLDYIGNLEPRIIYECEKGHSGNVSLEEYMNNYNKFSLCSNCCKSEKEDLFYCSVCKVFVCLSCIKNHKGEDHSISDIKRYDSLCIKDNNLFSFYCIECRKNLCIYCQKNHRTHELINLSEINYSNDSKLRLKKEIMNLEKKIEELDKIEENIKCEITKLKESTKLEIQCLNILIKTYEYEENKRNLNYNVILNLKNFDKVFRANKIQLYERIYNDSSKLLNILKNLKNLNSSFPNNSKILNNHTSCINHISKLSDGRLISCANDYLINIYKKNTYDLELSIKEHTHNIYFISELNDGRIISCSGDKTIKIFKLLDDNKYQIDQTLLGHSSNVYKAIEIKKNELISISYDKTMKLWKLNQEQKYQNILTIFFQDNNSYCNILKISENEFVTSSCSDYCIKFWNSNNFLNLATVNKISIGWTYNTMCVLDNNILCVGGSDSKGFYLINISLHQLIKNIIGPKNVYSITKCIDGLVLCSILDENGCYNIAKYEYDFEKKNLTKKVEMKNAHNKVINSCIELNIKTIASSSEDSTIKLWE